MTYIGPVYDETKLTPCTHCGMSERNCFSAKKAGCISCCPKCDHSKICPTCNRQDWQDRIPQSQPKSEWKPGMPVGEVKAFDGAGNEYMALIDFKELYPKVQRALNGKSDELEGLRRFRSMAIKAHPELETIPLTPLPLTAEEMEYGKTVASKLQMVDVQPVGERSLE